MSAPRLVLIGAPMYVSHLHVGAPAVGACARAASTLERNSHCALCGRRLGSAKHKHSHGYACHPRCKGMSQPPKPPATPAAATPAAAHPPRKRQRAESDPGQTQNLTRLRIRAPRPATIPAIKKARVQATPVDSSHLLDQAHARRMALIEAETNGTHAATVNASAVVWQS
jgi:hypothetical protein